MLLALLPSKNESFGKLTPGEFIVGAISRRGH